MKGGTPYVAYRDVGNAGKASVMKFGNTNPIVVNTATFEDYDNTNCSLLEAIIAANLDTEYHGCSSGSGADIITFAGNYTITLIDIQLPIISTEISINGNGPENSIIQVYHSPYITARVFQVNSNGNLTLNALTVRNGGSNSGSSFLNGGGILNAGILNITNSVISNNTTSYFEYGGGVYNDVGGTMTVANSTFSGNSSNQGNGGGIYNRGVLSVTNSTFLDNSAVVGGGIYNETGILTVTNSTFSNNSANYGGIETYYGGAIYNENGNNLHLKNTIMTNSSTGTDCYNGTGDTIATNINNLIETNGPSGHKCGTPVVTTDPALNSLTGSPAYFPLNANSPAIDAGNDATCASDPVNNTSQNGVTRPRGSHCDIGAFEYATPLPDLIITNVTINPTVPLPNQTFEISITIKNQGGTGSANTVFRDVYINRDPSTLLDSFTHCPPPGDFFRSDSYTSLPAGMTDTKTVTITGGLPVGSHQLWFYVDSRCLVDEGGGSNSVP